MESIAGIRRPSVKFSWDNFRLVRTRPVHSDSKASIGFYLLYWTMPALCSRYKHSNGLLKHCVNWLSYYYGKTNNYSEIHLNPRHPVHQRMSLSLMSFWSSKSPNTFYHCWNIFHVFNRHGLDNWRCICCSHWPYSSRIWVDEGACTPY